MAITISIPNKSVGGSLNRSTMKFTPNGTNATAITVTGTWPNFAFTLSATDGSFPAGVYSFTGHLNTPSNPCTGTGAIACGTVTWPSLTGTDPTEWEATGGPEDEEDDEVDDTEEPAADTE